MIGSASSASFAGDLNRLFVDAATAIRRAALAGFVVVVIGLFVIEQDFLAGFYISQGEKNQMAVNQSQPTIRIAGMVDELRSVAADRTVYRPVRIYAADANAAFAPQPSGNFGAGNSFADELGNLAPFFVWNGGETTFAVNLRWFDFYAGSQWRCGFQTSISKLKSICNDL